MPRSGQEARRRLQWAALELYREHGFDRTTTAEIAKRAGVTERTFFHQFADKREVLFGGEELLRALLVSAVRAVPGEPAPLDVLLSAFQSLEGVLEEGRSYSQPRHELVLATPALREREAAKLASLADSVADVLQERGVPRQPAVLAAHAAMAAFTVAVVGWYERPSEGLSGRLVSAFEDLRDICAGSSVRPAHPARPATAAAASGRSPGRSGTP